METVQHPNEPIYEETSEKVTAVEKCPSCGANMEYDPAGRNLRCDHCGTVKQIEVTASEEIAFTEMLAGGKQWSQGTHVYRCNNCNAAQILDKRDISRICPFCGTTNVVEQEELNGLCPNAVLPFLVDKTKAIAIADAWAKKRFFSPKDFKRKGQAEHIRGVYSPAFTFDAATASTYTGRLGRYYYRTERVNGRTVTRRYTEYYTISGRYEDFFDDVLVYAGEETESTRKTQPYDVHNSVAYNDEFLYGFSAQQYAKDGPACWRVARSTIEGWVKSRILSRYTYDFVQYLEVQTACSNITYKYLLLPVYVGHYMYKKKTYHFYINGRTGKLSGKAPVSACKVSLLSLGIAVGVALVVLLGKLLGFY